MQGYSKFFTFAALTDSKNHSDLVQKNRVDALQYQNAGKRLSKLLETIRHILGDHPIKVSSGFRNIALNKAIGSKAKNSTHMKFEAADIIISDRPLKEAFIAIMNAQRGGLLEDLRKVIREDHKGILHIEVKMDVNEDVNFYTTNDNVSFTRVS